MADLQRRLAALGYDLGADPAGDYGDTTRSAVVDFQRTRGLDPSGECDPTTWAAVIESEHSLGDRLLCLRTPMMRGDDVAELQLRLGTLGFDSGRVDGIFGPTTQRAVGEFQHNAGIIRDQVCGPDTVEALRRLAGRAGTASVTSVRERVDLRRAASGLGSIRVVLGAERPDDPVLVGVAAGVARTARAMLMLDGDWSAQAQAANAFGADVVLGITASSGDTSRALYFATDGFESVGGRSLAESVIRELPATPGAGIGVVHGMRLPILRETRAPAVLVDLTDHLASDQHRALAVAALHRALERWAHGPLD